MHGGSASLVRLDPPYFLAFLAFFFAAGDFADGFGAADFTFALTFDLAFVLVAPASGVALAVEVTLADFFFPLAGFASSFFFVVLAFLADLPNAASHPLEYASLVPTRRIVIDLLGGEFGKWGSEKGSKPTSSSSNTTLRVEACCDLLDREGSRANNPWRKLPA